MSFGNNPGDSAEGKARLDRLIAHAEARRAARTSGRKSLLRRVLGRLRPHRHDPGSEPHGFYGTPGDPGH